MVTNQDSEFEYEEYDEPIGIQRPVTIYNLETNIDGTISGTWFTDDNYDTGFQGEIATMEVSYRNRADMDRRAGKSRKGIGCDVEVWLDGIQI